MRSVFHCALTTLTLLLSLHLVTPLLGEDYWNDGSGGFNPQRVSMNYQRSAFFIAGGDYWSTADTALPKRNYTNLFSKTPDYVFDPSAPGQRASHLYTIPTTAAEVAAADPDLFRMHNGKVQAKMSTFYNTVDDFDNGYAGHNSQYDLHQNYALQQAASNYTKSTPTGRDAINGLVWLTPYGHLKSYMTAGGPADGQWTSDAATLENYELGIDNSSKNFTSGNNPYNRAAAALGMLNGAFGNQLIPNTQLGFGNFYRVADVWINAEDMARTSVQPSWKSDTIVAPGGTYDTTHRRPMLTDLQKQDYGYWGPESGRLTDPEQIAWRSSMTQGLELYGNDDDSGLVLSSVRSGGFKKIVNLTGLDWQSFLEIHGWADLTLPADQLLHLWSSDNNFGSVSTAFYDLWWEMNTITGGFPWTGHGFTYDWYNGYSDAQYDMLYATSTGWQTNSFSEFIVRPGADFEVIQTRELVEYLTGSPAVVAPSSVNVVPESKTGLLMLIGLAMLSRRLRTSFAWRAR
ncbi:MAG: hypothetical protein VX970_04710 [Planctomycetota bacterium]|nr:hypothetical protein [Planctomycetota bacterium]